MNKDIPYVETLPSHWSVIQNRFLFRYDGHKVGDSHGDYQLLSLTTSGVKERDINAGGGKVPTSYDNYQTVKKGQMIFCLFDLDCSAVFSGISNYDGMITSAYDVFSSTEMMDNGYADYWFKYVFSNRYYKMFSKSIRYTITGDMFRALKTPVPPMPEQKLICTFLREQEAKIDALILKVQAQIEKLEVYRQTVITEIVTKGLNPAVQMKNSGIQWIGTIPSHWGTPKISMLATVSSGATPDRMYPEYWGGNISWIKTGELQNDEIFESEEHITEEGLNNSSVQLYEPNTILVAMYGQGKTRGMTALLRIRSTTNQACAGIVVTSKLISYEFLWKTLIGAYNGLRELAVGSGQPNLNQALIKDFRIPLPPIEEQRAICELLEEKIPKIDRLITIKQAKVEKLEQYKRSLIYEYVTGKREVS